MTKSLPAAILLSLLVIGVARRVGSDGVLQQMEAILQDRRQSKSEAEAQSTIQRYEEQLKDIGTKEEQLKDIGTEEVLHEHGLDHISESEAEAIVTSAKGMLGDQTADAKMIGNAQAQKIVGEHEQLLEEIGAEKIPYPYDAMDHMSVHMSAVSSDTRQSMGEAEAQSIIHRYEEKLEDIGAKEVLHQYGLDQISEREAEGIVAAVEGMVGDPAMVQSIIQHNVKQLEDIGTREVLHEYGLDSISGSEAEAIVTAAEGMIGEHAVGGKTNGNEQAPNSLGAEDSMLEDVHPENTIEEVHAESTINDAAMVNSQAPSHSASRGDAQAILLQFNSSSIHHMLCLQLRLCSQQEGALQKHKHGLSHIMHLDDRQIASPKGSSHRKTKEGGTEGLLKRAKHGLAHIMHLDGSESNEDNMQNPQAEGPFQRAKHNLAHILHLAGSQAGGNEKAPSDYAKEFSENEARNARKIITEYNKHEKSFGEYDKVITENEAQKIIGDYEKMLADFWDTKPVSNAEVQKARSASERMHSEKRLDKTGSGKMGSVWTKRVIESQAPSAFNVAKKTFDDFETIVGDIGSEKSKVLYRDLIQSLAQHQDDVDNTAADAKAAPSPKVAPEPALPVSFLQVAKDVTEKHVTKNAPEGHAVVNDTVTEPSHQDKGSTSNVVGTSEAGRLGLAQARESAIAK